MLLRWRFCLIALIELYRIEIQMGNRHGSTERALIELYRIEIALSREIAKND